MRFQVGDLDTGIVFADYALDDHVDVSLTLSLDAISFRLQPGTVSDRFGGKPPPLVVVSSSVGFYRCGFLQFLSHAVDHGILNVAQIDDAPVRAGPAFPDSRAAYPRLASLVPVVDRHARSAATAAQQPGKQVGRATLQMRHHKRSFRLALLSLHPSLFVDDPQVGSFDILPFARRIGLRYPLAGIRVLQHSNLVPDDAPYIELVEDQAGPPLRIAVYRGGVPARTAWRQNTFAIEVPCDLARRSPSEKSCEDAADDL